MSTDLRSFLHLLVMVIAQWPASAALAAETIYALTSDDGAVSLSNVPTERAYRPLITPAATDARAAAGSERVARPAPAGKARFDSLVARTASDIGVDGALLHAIISVESRYDPAARSPAGASGLMQLMPATAKRYGVVDAFDPAQNLRGGARYLRDLLEQFDSDVNLALAAYNAGETAVAKYGGVPPFAETSAYVPRVLAYYRRYQADGQAPE